MSKQDLNTLVLGGMRSGKSRFAEQLAEASELAVTYIATAQARLDGESGTDQQWLNRIEAHKARRPEHWHCVEEPLRLAAIIEQYSGNGQCLLVDCLSLWLTNLLLKNDEQLLQQEKQAFINAVKHYRGRLILVSVESSLGIVPLDQLTRRYCDEIGILHQALASNCHQVILVIAGLPQYLKGVMH